MIEVTVVEGEGRFLKSGGLYFDFSDGVLGESPDYENKQSCQ